MDANTTFVVASGSDILCQPRTEPAEDEVLTSWNFLHVCNTAALLGCYCCVVVPQDKPLAVR